MNSIIFDFSEKSGKIKPMHAINNGPVGSKVRGTSGNYKTFEEARIPYSRNHDASFFSAYGGEHTVDVHRIFKNFDADENDPASYVFGPTDNYVANCFSVGTEVFYRLGAAIEHGYKYGTYPPADFEKWARICEHIIRHYNEGWADGFHYGIKYWEIWNEPDCRNMDGSNPCWQGTDEQFADFFCTALAHLKKCFPELKIGGPAICSVKSDHILTPLFTELQRRGLKLDFFSYHEYAVDPSTYVDVTAKAKAWLEKYGQEGAELILNEWNYCREWSGSVYKLSRLWSKQLKGASFVAGSMIAAQKSPMDMFMYYNATPGDWCGLWSADTSEPLKPYYTFPMFSELYARGTEVKSETDHEKLWALAASDENGADVMFTYYDDADDAEKSKDIKVVFKGLEGQWRVSWILLDETHDAELIRSDIVTNGTELYLNLPLYSVYRFKIEKF